MEPGPGMSQAGSERWRTREKERHFQWICVVGKLGVRRCGWSMAPAWLWDARPWHMQAECSPWPHPSLTNAYPAIKMKPTHAVLWEAFPSTSTSRWSEMLPICVSYQECGPNLSHHGIPRTPLVGGIKEYWLTFIFVPQWLLHTLYCRRGAGKCSMEWMSEWMTTKGL